MPWRTFEHTADVGLESTGPDMATLFGDLARGFFAVVAGEAKVGRGIERAVQIEAKDLERLVMDLLDEFIFLIDAEGLVFSDVRDVEVRRVEREEGTFHALTCRAFGEPFDRAKHAGATHVKAVTHHELLAEAPSAGKEGRVRVILDI